MNHQNRCTCELQCTSGRAASLFCSQKIGIRIAKCTFPWKFTNVHKFTKSIFFIFSVYFGSIFGSNVEENDQKVVKNSELVNISELYRFSRQFLPCNLFADFLINGRLSSDFLVKVH